MKKLGIMAALGAAIMSASTAFASLSISVSAAPPSTGSLVSKVSTILGAAQWIGFIVGVAMIIYIGVKYITAGAGQKAEVKSTMVPLFVGAILVMLAPTIATWIFSI